MHVVNDLMSGLSYCAITSRPKAKAKRQPKHESTLAEGLGIVATFLACGLAILIAI